ncbi:hypothetical protein DBR47_14535 [Paucibacter sp. KBW04]|uniref:hypothetical protein n=1 Tax=Paucibacter sp. KBW04 TaxID=2153361 RepID=UPI000F55E818|nr:hypothetical protein [Paucibacter sp. KBW04]RQO58006.1 hypothetical protein DBR47_14535 [Paucibacter sp. KBW04]
MKERPILFNGAMVRAVLAGTKTQTRRIFKAKNGGVWPNERDLPGMRQILRNCSYGQPGDRLWVRETFAEGIHQMADVNHWAYAADRFGEQQRLGDLWKPSIHMPRAASRLTLEVTGVRVERLQDISEADAQAEGAMPLDPCDHARRSCAEIGCSGPQDYRGGFKALWESINGPGSWEANPWLWVVEFKKTAQGASA